MVLWQVTWLGTALWNRMPSLQLSARLTRESAGARDSFSMKTRIRELKDGAQEIIRLLSPEELEAWSKDDPLSYEKSIVWLSDIAQLPFVRARLVQGVMSRRGPIYLGDDARVVGYSKLTLNAPRSADTNGYIRRVFYLKPGDLARRPPDVPSSAVDPRTVLPGVPGEVVKPT